MTERSRRPVFFDPGGRRQRFFRAAVILLAVLVSVLGGIFVASVLVNPWLPALSLKPVLSLPPPERATELPVPALETPRGRKARKARNALTRALEGTERVPSLRPSQINPLPPRGQVTLKLPPGRPVAAGFYVNWDDSSYQSLKRHLNDIDWLVPEWIRLDDGPHPLALEIDRRALGLIRRERPDLPIVPMLHNSRFGKWEPETLARTLDSPERQALLARELLTFVKQNGFSGIAVDFEEVPADSQEDLIDFMNLLARLFRPEGLALLQAVPADDDAWNYTALADACDYLMLMAYDEHWAEGEPGPVASQKWFTRILEKRLSELDSKKTLVCLGGYGYDWAKGLTTREVTYQEALLAARDSSARVRFDRSALNSSYVYEDEEGRRHEVWLLDGLSGYNQILAARELGVAGFALWRLGSEDPSLWTAFGASAKRSDPESLRRIRYGYDVDFEGMGEILQIIARPQEGRRTVAVDPGTGLVISSQLEVSPSSYVIRRFGYRPGYAVLTFDDGPDPVFTPRILDILARENVKASFFIIGQNGQANPGIVKRIVADGHDIGNHSYTHPNLGEVPARLTDLELNATQRLIESLTGRSTRLFRAPYFGDAEPTTPDEVEPAERAERLGYLSIGLRVDPDDWALPGADQIVKRTMDGLLSQDPEVQGQIVLLHDGGGDRTQTVEALPRLIAAIRSRGIRIVTVSELAGLTRDQAMPPLSPSHRFFPRVDTVVFFVLGMGGWLLQVLFVSGILLGISRLFFIGSLALIHRLAGRHQLPLPEPPPPVSILVPAYNEARVIVRTVESLLASTYPDFEVVVVDDGSTDETAEVVRTQFGEDPRVRLFSRPNAGKSAALNFGMRQARGRIVVALDADTLFEPGTVANLVRHFSDSRVGAVAGNAKVGNRINLVTRWQALEYITAQNLDRRAFTVLNAITVVPGSVGAWRKDLVEAAGGFPSDTLAEDQDLTLQLRRQGHRIAFAEDAIAWTEAPDTLKGLAKQRFRWSFGTLQCLWKHRAAFLSPSAGTLGFIALPNNWIFQILFPLLSPVVDLMLVLSLFSSILERLEHPAGQSATNLGPVLFYYAFFLAVDWLGSAFAFLLERNERWSLLLGLFLQRFAYRQVMYGVMVRSVVAALRGGLVGWGKLERKATAATGG